MKLSEFKTREERRIYLEKVLKIKLDNIERSFIDDKSAVRCENLIGATSLPLGVVGPLKISSNASARKDKQNYYIPLATSEGALVASVNRGCKAITLSGGAKVFIEKVGATRGPVYLTKNLEKGFWFVDWLKKNEARIKKAAEKTSKHLKFLKFEGKVVGSYTFVRFYFDTQEAMGMNMVTIATDSINRLIEAETSVVCLSLSGNFCVDKKPAWLNFIDSRGFAAWAEVVIPQKIIKNVLKSNAQDIFEVWLTKCMIGSAMSGSLGFNSHFANMVAAFFAATGQDLAHVVEGSLGITTAKVLDDGDLYFSVYLPSLMLGTVGGGTNLKTKKEALSIIGVKTSTELAEVLVGTVLAGELSLLSSLEEGTLAQAHEKLGR
jgi:hydroxymethylglutaryl-CoA reductase (NADPH)